MRVAFTGAQGTGKTTLLKALKEKFPEYAMHDEIVRNLNKRYPMGISREGTDYTQAMISNEHLNLAAYSFYNEHNAFFDRCIVDSHSFAIDMYDRMFISENAILYSKHIFDTIFQYFPYDLIIYIPPTIKLVEDGVRDTDIEYQQTIDKIMKNQLEEIDKSRVCIHTLRALSVKHRIEVVEFLINDYVNWTQTNNN